MGSGALRGRTWGVVLGVCMIVVPAVHAGYETIWDNGLSSNRVDIVFMGDGYTASQISTVYNTHIQSMLNHMFSNHLSDPFVRYKNFFNVHKINVVSNESGADKPKASPAVYKDTALGSTYWYDGVTERLLFVDYGLTYNTLNTNLAGAPFSAEMKLITVNDTKYGGGGGAFAVYAGGNSSSTEVAMHELGHSFSNLADEYTSYSGAYVGGEPYQVNVTKDSTGQKWSQWLGYTDPNHPEMGAIGAYQGGYYYPQGIYRPSVNSKMQNLDRPFDAISREKIILDIYRYVDPLDSWLSNVVSLTDPASLWVDPVDSNVIRVDWMVDGVNVADGDSFDPLGYGLAQGNYTITAHAYDPTGWVRRNTEQLMQDISWSIVLTPEPGTLLLLLLGTSTWLRHRKCC